MWLAVALFFPMLQLPNDASLKHVCYVFKCGKCDSIHIFDINFV